MAESPFASLDDVRAEIRRISADLDPESRYVRELLETVDDAADVADFEARLDRGCRGQWHAGADVFAHMRLGEKILTNLITSETALLRFTEGEVQAVDRFIVPRVEGRTARVLVVPCSHGEEAYTMAAFLLKRDLDFRILAFDIQPALVEEARTGRLTFGYPVEYLERTGKVSRDVLERIRFEVGDAFALPLGREEAGEAPAFDIVLCRNFLGYFVAEKAVGLAVDLARRVAAGGTLFLDSFCTGKFGDLDARLAAHGLERLGGRPVYVKAQRPGSTGAASDARRS